MFVQGRASGNHAGLWVRSKIQEEMFQLGSIIQVYTFFFNFKFYCLFTPSESELVNISLISWFFTFSNIISLCLLLSFTFNLTVSSNLLFDDYYKSHIFVVEYILTYFYFVKVHAGKVLFTGLLLLSSLTIGLKSVKVEDRIDRLWVVEGGRVAREMEYMDSTLGEGAGGVNQMLIQTGEGSNLLSADSLLHHLKILKRASRVTVQKDDM